MNYAPLFIREMIREGRLSGSFRGAVLLADIVGFTPRFDKMTGLGAEGAEIISQEVSNTLSTVVDVCAEFGGFPVSFAGDAVTIVFPGGIADAGSACEKIDILTGDGLLPIRNSTGEGLVVWDAIPMDGWIFYSFQGSAVRQALLSGGSNTGSRELLPDPESDYELVISEDIATDRFISAELFTNGTKNEFRQVVNIFLSLENRDGSNCPREFQKLVLNTAEELGGFVSGLEAGMKEYHILIVFGAPISMEDDSKRVDYFLQQVFAKSSGRVKAGVASGLVFSGLLKTQLLESYTVLGPSVNLAARLHNSARWNSVYSGPFFNRESQLEMLRAEKVVLKGISRPVRAMVLSPWRKRSISTEGLPPFTGRSELLDHVESRLNNNGAEILLTGISGIGKTRFAAELCSGMKGVFVLSVSSEGLSGESSDIHTRWLGEWMGLDSTEDGLTVFREKLYNFVDLLEGLGTEEADETANELLRAESVIAALAGFQWERSLYQRLDPEARFRNTVSATAAFILGHCMLHKTIMVFDDIQWMARDSVTLLSSVLKELGEKRPSILLLARPGLNETVQDLGLTPEETKLPPLSKEDCKSFLRWGLSREPSEKLLEWFYLRTEGIPFFMEQYALMLTSAVEPPDGDSFPGNIHALLVARLDRLDLEFKKSVLTASILGRVFDPRILQGVMSVTDLRAVLKKGVVERIWEHTTDGLYSFVHLLLREAAYNLQLHSERKKLHAAAAEVMERIWALFPEKAVGIAHHLEKSEKNDKAAFWYLKAGRYSYSRKMLSSTLEQMEKVLELSTETSIRLEAHEMISTLYISGGRLKEAEKAIESAWKESFSPEERARVLLMKVSLFLNMGKPEEATACLEDAEKMNPELRPQVLGLRGRILMLQAKPEEALHLLLHVYDELKNGSSGETLLAIKALGNASSCMLRLRKLEEAEQALKQVLAFAVEKGDILMETVAVGNLALVYKYLPGKHYEAVGMTRRHLELARKTGSRLLELQAVGNLGTLLEREAPSPEALKLLEKAVSLSRKYGGNETLSISLANLGRTLQRYGKLEEAMRLMKKSIDICLNSGFFVHQIDYAYELVHVLMDLGKLDEAQALIEQIDEWTSESEYEYSRIWCRGRLLRLRNRKEEAVKLLEEGLKIFSSPEDRFNLLEQLYLATGEAETLQELLDCGEEMLKETPDWYAGRIISKLKNKQTAEYATND